MLFSTLLYLAGWGCTRNTVGEGAAVFAPKKPWLPAGLELGTVRFPHTGRTSELMEEQSEAVPFDFISSNRLDLTNATYLATFVFRVVITAPLP